MIKKLSILFTCILIINLQFNFTPTLGFVTTVNAEVSVDDGLAEDQKTKNLINSKKNAESVTALKKYYSSNISVFKVEKPKTIFNEQELATIEKYRNQVIPIYYYINDDSFNSEYNEYHTIRLAVELLKKQTGLNFELVTVEVDPTKPIDEQLKTRKSTEVCLDVIKSNNLALADERFPEIIVSRPVFNDSLFIITNQSRGSYEINIGDTIGYDMSTFSYQTEDMNSTNTQAKSMSPNEANKQLKNDVIDFYFATSSMNLPTVMHDSYYMYTENQNQPAIKNAVASLNGLTTNVQNEDLMNVVNKALTDNLVAQVEKYNQYYIAYIKETSFYNSLTKEEIEFLQNTEELSIVYNDSKNILHYEGETYVGLIPDIMTQLTSLTGIVPVYTEPTTLNYVDGKFASSAKDVNIIALYTTQVAEELKNDFNTSSNKETYSSLFSTFTHQMEVVKYYQTPDITSLNQLKFSVLGTSSSFLENTKQFLETNNITDEYLIVYDTKEELLAALQDGSIDYAFVTPGTTKYYANLTEYGIATAHIKQSVINTPTDNWTFLVHSNTDVAALNSIISKTIASMDGHQLFEKWFTTKPEYEVYNKLKQTNEFLLYFSAILIVFALTIITHFNNTRQRNFRKVNKAVNYDNLTKLKNGNLFKDENSNIDEGIFIVGQFSKLRYATQMYGTAKADQIVLEQIKILKELCGEENIYRITANKFYIVLDEAEAEITNLTKKIYNKISEGVVIDGYPYQLGWIMASSPISLFKNNFKEVISTTNMSCENCEYNGKYKYIVVDEKEYAAIAENTEIKNSLKIITPNNVYPYYQPFLDAETLKVKGCEVLARLIINDEIIPAYKFISEAEKLGTLGDIDEMLLEKTIALRSDLLVKGIIDSNFYFSVNLSAQYLKKMTSDDLYTLARRFNLKSFDFLQIEILEEELSKDEIVKIKRIIREFNLRTAIDDFSTGHSTIARLNNFNFDVVKMDRSLLPINFTELDKQIYLSLISMVSGFSNEIVVEGVETEEHVAFLQKTSVSTLQGFYFAKPMASNHFVEYILTTNEM